MAPFSLSTRPRRSLPDGYQFGDANEVNRVGRILRKHNFSGMFQPSPEVCAAYERVRRMPMSEFLSDGDPVESTPITSDYATDYSQRSPYVTDRDPGDETPTRRLRRREA